jgi:hypothetical protein
VLVPSGVVPFEVEVARDDETRARGLMNRDHLDANKGMLFVFDQMERLSFWMKNTLIPLDMIFIDDTGVVVGVVANAEPLTETSRRVDAKSQYVLEVQGGMAEKRGITPGVRVRFEGVPGHPAKASAAVR